MSVVRWVFVALGAPSQSGFAFVPRYIALHMSQSAAGSFGQCSVCGSVFRLVASSGVLRKHGWCSSQPASCAGSGKLPLDLSF